MNSNIITENVDKTGRKRQSSILAVICISLVFILMGSFVIFKQVHQSKICTEKVDAVIVENIRKKMGTGHRKRTKYQAVYSYVYEGREYEVKSKNSSNPAVHSEGDRVTIYVDPDNPTEIYDPKDRSGMVICVVFIGIGILMPVREIRRRIKNQNNNNNNNLNLS